MNCPRPYQVPGAALRNAEIERLVIETMLKPALSMGAYYTIRNAKEMNAEWDGIIKAAT